jgi:hypothetical protein
MTGYADLCLTRHVDLCMTAIRGLMYDKELRKLWRPWNGETEKAVKSAFAIENRVGGFKFR